MIEQNQVLIPEVVFMNGTTWRKCPGYVNTFISVGGKVALMNSKNQLIKPTIIFRLSDKRPKETKDKLLSKYVFKVLADNVTWPDYSREEAIKEEIRYNANSNSVRKNNLVSRTRTLPDLHRSCSA